MADYITQLYDKDGNLVNPKTTSDAIKINDNGKTLKEYLTETNTIKIEPLENDIPKVFFEGNIDGMSKTNEKILKFSYNSKTKTINGYVKMKWQGTSSIRYPKKNFTIKIFSDEACENKSKFVFKNWKYKTNKYVLKANYIDHSHARNIVSARLWSDIVSSRSDYDTLPEEIKSSPNNCAVDGFPIKLYMNGSYEGLYTWNIGKDGWTYGMTDDENLNHAILCGEDYNSGCFRALANINGSDWSLEYPDILQESIRQSWNNAISFVMNNDGEDFKNGLSNYFDITSLIDYYIFAYFSCGLDSMGKNQIYTTYDGTKWYANMYDMDTTWGLYWDGSRFVSTNYKCQENYESMLDGRQGNLLYLKLTTSFYNEINERYNELRKNVLSIENVFTKFERFTDIISTDLYSEDIEIYTAIPSATTNNIKQIRRYTKDRVLFVDQEIHDLIPIPVESISISDITLSLNTMKCIEVGFTPSNSNRADFEYTIEDENIATINKKGLIIPKTIGNCIITVRSKYNNSISATCNLTVTEEIEDSNLLFNNHDLVFNGNNYIDTEVKLFDIDKSFSIYIDFNGGNNNNVAMYTVLHCMNENSPFYGIALDINGSFYRFASANNQFNLCSKNYTGNQKYIITHTVGENTVKIYSVNENLMNSVNIGTPYNDEYLANLTLKLGAYQENSGTIGRYWNGNINKILIWNKVIEY